MRASRGALSRPARQPGRARAERPPTGDRSELLDGLEAVVWEADPGSMRLTFVSQHAETMFGYPTERWLADPAFWLSLVHPDDRAAAAASRAALASTDRLEVEYRAVARDGGVVWVRDVARVARDRPGRPRRVYGMLLDVGDRAALRERLAAAEQQAAQGERLRLLGQMASGVAHDLNQSLALVAGYGELARRGLEEDPPDVAALRAAVAVISQAAHDGGETLRRLLAFSRNRVEGVSERIDLAALLGEVAQLTAPRWRDAAQAEGRRIDLAVEADGDTVVNGWAAGLRDALTNLIFNAVDALPGGGTIRLAARREGEQVVVEVADSGVGMPADVQARAFEPFFTTKGEKGTGLGLAMVFAIAKQHRGDVSVSSTPGAGTIFRLVLPPASGAAAAGEQGAAGRIGGRPARALRVLAVDDQPALAQMIADLLESVGHGVVAATSAEEALLRLEEQPFDVVVSDVGMGAGMNGFDLAQRVRERWPSIRIVLATGWGSLIEMDEARRRGVDAVVPKPYRLIELRRAIEPGPA